VRTDIYHEHGRTLHKNNSVLLLAFRW